MARAGGVWGGGGVRRRRWWCLGAPMGPLTKHAVVPPHCAGSSSVASLPCGHSREWKRKIGKEREERGKTRGGQRERGSGSGRFGMDRGRVPIILEPPPESTLTKLSPVWPFTSSRCDYSIVSDLFKARQCNFALWRPRVVRADKHAWYASQAHTGCWSWTPATWHFRPDCAFSASAHNGH